jgi:hypothetical protein
MTATSLSSTVSRRTSMCDIITRPVGQYGIQGLSNRDLTRMCAQVIKYRNDLNPDDRGKDNDTTLANIIKRIREDNDGEYYTTPNSITFIYDRAEFMLVTEDLYTEIKQDTLQMYVDDMQSEVDHMLSDNMLEKIGGYLAPYVKFDADMYLRDLEYDADSLIASYDGQVDELRWCVADDITSNIVTGEGYLYLWRVD